MKGLTRALRFWLILPIAFISLAAVAVTGVISYRAWQFEKEVRQAQRQAIESHIFSESAKIAEEVYLKLDNWEAREKQLATFFQGHNTKIKIRFEPKVGDGPKSRYDDSHFVWQVNPNDDSREVLVVPLFFGDVFLGNLLLDLTWNGGWFLGGIGNLGSIVLGVLTCLIAGWLVTFITFRKRVFYPMLERMVHLNRLEAISETTQMIAHDIRKPFHMLRLCLQALQRSTDPKEFKSITVESALTIDRVSNEVEEMLRDIIDLERSNNLQVKETSLANLIETVVADHKSQQEEKECVVSYDLGHSSLAMIDKSRIHRVMENLLRNAFQAVERGGRIWIVTKDYNLDRNGKYLSVTIGNSGSKIETDDIPRLFDRFFTKGKPDGTGLGLAIAKKFISGHGGEIRCQSSLENGTEFHFTIPAGANVSGECRFYRSSDLENINDAKQNTQVAEVDFLDGHQSATLRQGTKNAEISHLSPVRVALLGSDSFYLEALTSLLETYVDPAGVSASVIGAFSLGVNKPPESALANADLIIIDGDETPDNGLIFEWVSQLSGSGLICIHSSKSTEARMPQLSIQCEYLSKPMDSLKIESVLRKASLQRIRSPIL